MVDRSRSLSQAPELQAKIALTALLPEAFSPDEKSVQISKISVGYQAMIHGRDRLHL